MVGPLFSQGMGTRSSRQVEEDHFPFDQFDSQNSELQVGEKNYRVVFKHVEFNCLDTMGFAFLKNGLDTSP